MPASRNAGSITIRASSSTVPKSDTTASRSDATRNPEEAIFSSPRINVPSTWYCSRSSCSSGARIEECAEAAADATPSDSTVEKTGSAKPDAPAVADNQADGTKQAPVAVSEKIAIDDFVKVELRAHVRARRHIHDSGRGTGLERIQQQIRQQKIGQMVEGEGHLVAIDSFLATHEDRARIINQHVQPGMASVVNSLQQIEKPLSAMNTARAE